MRYLVGDSPTKGYEEFLLETLNKLDGSNVKSLAVVVFTEEETLTAYYNMCCMDKAYAAVNIQADYMDEVIQINRDRYFGDNNESEDNDNG